MVKIAAILCAVCMIAVPAAMADDSNSMKQDGFSTSYSYYYDYWGDVQISPDPYRVLTTIDTTSLGLEKLNGVAISSPQGMFVRNNDLYIADTGNNRILWFHFDEASEEFSLVQIFDQVLDSDVNTFSNILDLFVDAEGNIYVADNGNNRVIMCSVAENGSAKELHQVKVFTKPDDSTYNQASAFLPSKIAVDVSGRLYVLATNVNKGFLKYEADTVFSGYIGANAVKVDMASYIWKRYFMTKEQRAASQSFVPTEYKNMYIDEKDFIYATTTVFDSWDLKSDAAKPIRRLNSLGNDILIKNDRYPPIGDLDWKDGNDVSIKYGPSKMVDITAMKNEIYVALDGTRGRLFGYDSQGIMLWAFGTKGALDGAFDEPIALDHMGYNLIVLDDKKNSITVFTPTEYGRMIYDAVDTYLMGEYEKSAALWEKVMALNANYPSAFRGIGRSMLREEKYEEAMDYFKLAHDQEDYGRAFKQYRKIWIEKNLWWIALIIAVLLIVPLVIGRIKRAKWEVVMHEHSKVHNS